MRKIAYHIGRLSEKEQLKLDFKDALSRPVEERVKLGFIVMKMPIIDEMPYRIFDTIGKYRMWADKNFILRAPNGSNGIFLEGHNVFWGQGNDTNKVDKGVIVIAAPKQDNGLLRFLLTDI